MAKRSPLSQRSPLRPGAYGKPQRWHEILTEAADARAAKRDDQRRRNADASETVLLIASAATITIVDSST